MIEPDGIRVADVGTVLTIPYKDENGAAVNVSTATSQTLVFRKPDGSFHVTRNTSFVTNGSDGQCKYVLVSGDFTVAGYWTLQAVVVLAGGATYHAARVRVRVWPNNPTS